ncbi:cilia- and flagella-associated protein 77 [Gadus macrocephalus]|uniref:cilia- and flagella-associated protein 77 n=1 Tax=Gadus macrocephalus TaxID=80720 RepID=UPI0028CBA619|nr:cilia- and flagella-associated protein 77 [Gadus macrocephalus]
MDSPRLGVVRESMLANPLLFGRSLGHSRSSHLPLPRPGPDFVYGTRNTAADGGVAEALSFWRVQPAAGGSARLQPLPVDYVSMNREGLKSGLVTAKELTQYKAQWASENHLTFNRPRNHSRPTNRAIPDITFGITTRPPSPLADLLAHHYGQRWIDEQQRHMNSETKQPDKAKLCISDTRTSLLRKSRPLPKSEPQCTIRRFTKVGPALDTFRDPESRLRAFRAHRSDCVSRRGALGQGTYNLD